MRQLTVLVAILFCITGVVCAQDSGPVDVDVYGLGDQTFSINAGVMIPLFFFGLQSDQFVPAMGDPRHLRIGASGALRWGTFLDNSLSIGAEFGGMFASTVLDRTLIAVPITAVADYAFRFYPFEAAIHANLGVNFLRLDSDLYIGPILKPGASFYWNYNSEWSFGLRAEYWFVPELYFGTNPPSSESRFGNFLTINLSTLYHF